MDSVSTNGEDEEAKAHHRNNLYQVIKSPFLSEKTSNGVHDTSSSIMEGTHAGRYRAILVPFHTSLEQIFGIRPARLVGKVVDLEVILMVLLQQSLNLCAGIPIDVFCKNDITSDMKTRQCTPHTHDMISRYSSERRVPTHDSTRASVEGQSGTAEHGPGQMLLERKAGTPHDSHNMRSMS